jgi:hypothetical protein
MYFSVMDLQPDSPAAAITITTGRHRAEARRHEFARIENSPCLGHRLEAGHCLDTTQNYPTPEARQGKWVGNGAHQSALS